MLAITTFPEWAWDVYAERCIGSWVQSWPGEILAYYEGAAPPPSVPGISLRPLLSEERDKFLSIRVPQPPNFLYDVKRFCHKVFAQLLAMGEAEQFFWIDADVEMTHPIPEVLLQEIMDQDFVSFLGRRDTYTETGFIAFNQKHEDFDDFEKRYSYCYEDAGIFKLPYWTDCHAFDYARQGGGHNMTPEGKGVDNVLPDSPLGEYMVHYKGLLKMKLEEQ